MLTILEHIPEGLLDATAQELHQLLPGPALIHLPGRRPQPLFVSILLHGNEDTGLRAVQSILRQYHERELPRALSLFIGNISAAREGLRRLDNQPDYNRVWPGAEDDGTPEHAMMRQVLEEMRSRNVFASIDIHNNTGLNPHYGCVNRLDQRFFHVATLFSRIVVYFIRPTGVQSAALAELCPAVTIECGKAGTPEGDEHAARFIEACLHLSEFPVHAVPKQDMDLFHTVAIVKVPPGVRFGFGATDLDICFRDDLDYLNFRELPIGTGFGSIASPHFRLEIWDEDGNDVGDRFFDHSTGEIRTRRRLMPSMLTKDERVIRQDCLCYLMERLEP
jgi:succinylglutamate desuccinylase